MRALILAGGLGSRLGALTQERPKALVPVNGRPILAYQIDALRAAGITEIGIVLGYQAERIPEFMQRAYPMLTPQYWINDQYADSNSSYSFWFARDWIGPSYVHLNCDVIFDERLIRRVMDAPYSSALAIRRDVSLEGQMEHVAVDGDLITRMDLAAFPGMVGKAYGLAKLGSAQTDVMRADMDRHLSQGDRHQNCFGLIRHAIPPAQYHVVDAGTDLLVEVNTPDDLARAEEALQRRLASAEGQA